VRASSNFRLAVTLLAISAWFGVSNHCALAAIQPPGRVAVAHAHCHGPSAPAPAKQQNGEDMPCCKTLKAVTPAKISANPNVLDFTPKDYFSIVLLADVSLGRAETLELDTGPPRALSFSESVLQRSLLAHAPPLSLS